MHVSHRARRTFASGDAIDEICNETIVISIHWWYKPLKNELQNTAPAKMVLDCDEGALTLVFRKFHAASFFSLRIRVPCGFDAESAPSIRETLL